MPDSAVLSALQSLLPSYPALNKPFPRLLISQSESLLALSRQRASHLKPPEEIARAHACVEIACSRLKAQLRLPGVSSGGVPCPPKVYAKLVKLLDGALADAVVGPTTPRGKKRDGEGNVKTGSASAATTPATATKSIQKSKQSTLGDTPTKKASRTKPQTPGSTFVGTIKPTRKGKTPKSKSKNGTKTTSSDIQDDKAPSFVMPSIRTLCKIFHTPQLIPHVYTGTCIILNLSGLWSSSSSLSTWERSIGFESSDEDDDDEDYRQRRSNHKTYILTLITALYLMVLTRMQTTEMTTEIYITVTERSIDALGLDKTTGVDVYVDMDGGDGDQGSASLKIEECIDFLNDQGWCAGQDWWDSVPEGVVEFGGGNGGDIDNEDEEGGDDDDRRRGRDEEEIEGDEDVIVTNRMKRRRNGDVVRNGGRKDAEVVQDENRPDPEGVLLPGLGTMLHDGIDWLSEDRCADFEDWRADIMSRLSTSTKVGGKRGRVVAV